MFQCAYQDSAGNAKPPSPDKKSAEDEEDLFDSGLPTSQTLHQVP